MHGEMELCVVGVLVILYAVVSDDVGYRAAVDCDYYNLLLLKFCIFENPRWRRPPSQKSQKLRYFSSGMTDIYKIWHSDAEWVS